MKALTFNKFGGPDVLQYSEIPQPSIGDHDVLVQTKAIGLNFADIYRRKGNYHLVGEPPYILGYEGAGLVVKVGTSIKDIKVGDRIAFADVPHANAELVSVPYDKAIPIPDGVTYEHAASLLLQGLTAHYLVHDSYQVKNGDTVLVHAAAGGVGQLLTQLVTILGGTTIGLTSTPEKSDVAKKAGAKEVLLYKTSWAEKVKELTAGEGVEVVYESVGSTLMDSFQATRIGGTVVFYGMAGGDPVHVDPRMLMDTSKTLTGGDLWNVLKTREIRMERAAQLFQWLQEDKLRIESPTLFSLEDGAKAHELLESRKSTGKIVLIP
ncbi:quinone oxidoreductase family protein [Bacillus sp. CHD6a]|uniref:quinone oxidoreductase family protein n=1 Tax=Bacillus sp. CHD6a TaxID=1643452 RepID=UPI0006CD8276|nr:quinone oxidoreductase [Bacillus sp. CHD6a]KPB04964.1 alcohol dehydrogenase [Bacillus sp. CHD6a]